MNAEDRHELKEQIWEAVHNLVDEMTEGLSEEDDELIRLQLTDQFRFWRRRACVTQRRTDDT